MRDPLLDVSSLYVPMFFPFFAGNTDTEGSKPPLALYNTMGGVRERFAQLKSDFVRLYSCGPTVYDSVHIGNLRAYLLSDTIRRVLRYNGYKVKQVMNVTDIGHLSGDGDVGEDKMALAVKRAGKPMTLESLREVADVHIASFLADIDAMNIKRPHAMPRPSDCIPEQIALIETLMDKAYAYETSDGVYFDTARFPTYGRLGDIDIEGLKEGARIETHLEKRSGTDFALWKKGDEIGWDSPWGRGFPGWHIECSVMAMKHLGKQIDIHTGGEDLARVHHNNEIAQSEAATGKQFARFWLHNAFLNIDNTKISKSLGNTLRLQQLTDAGYPALAYRYWLLTAHYRSPVNFSWDALDGARTTLKRLHRFFFEDLASSDKGAINADYALRFHQAINDDLDTPRAIALLWELVKDEHIPRADKKATLLDFDKVLGIGLLRTDAEHSVPVTVSPIALKDLPEDVRLLVIARDEMRDQKEWKKADELRDEIASHGFTVEDHPEGVRVYRTTA